MIVLTESGFKGWGAARDNGVDDEREGECDNWDYGNSQRCDSPEFLLCVSGEKKVPPRTVDATEGGAKGNQKEDVIPLGIPMVWDVERRDVRVVRGEGR